MATTANKPLVCKLTTPELRRRRATVIADLKSLVLARGERNDGYSYRFEGTNANLDRLTEFIKTERVCCDFFTFQLTVDGVLFGLVTGEEDGEGWAELYPDRLGFGAPWDGSYDT